MKSNWLVLSILILPFAIIAEELTPGILEFSAKDTSIIIDEGVLNEHTIYIHNSSGSEQEITITRRDQTSPEEWSITMCTNVCFPPFITEADWLVPAMDSVGLKVDLTLPTATEGEAVMTFDVALKGSEPLSTITMSYATEGFLESPIHQTPFSSNQSKPLSLMRTGSSYSLTIPQSGFTTVSLYTALGQKVETLYSGNITGNSSLILPTSGFASGFYIVTVTQNGQNRSIPMNLL